MKIYSPTNVIISSKCFFGVLTTPNLSFPKFQKSAISPHELISQIKSIPAIRLFPSQKKLISKYLSFLEINFNSKQNTFNQEEENEKSLKQLNNIIAKIHVKNESFVAYIDACLQTAEVTKALQSLELRRKESRDPKNMEKGTFIQSDRIFELLCQHFASQTDWISIERTLNYLQQDGIPVTFNICLSSLECIGSILHRLEQGKLTSTKKISIEDTHIFSYLESRILEILSLATKNNLNLYTGFLSYPRRKNSLKNILTALLYAKPDSNPDVCYLQSTVSQTSENSTLEITRRISTTLQKATMSKVNIFSNIFPDTDSMMSAFREQLQLETTGFINITPVLPFFDEVCSHLPKPRVMKVPKSQKTLATMKKLLLVEQNIWRKKLTSAFESTLQRLKIGHSHGNVTAYPFLKILPRKAYVDIMIEMVTAIVTDSELQHISRILFLMKLGQRVETASLVWRKQHAGIIDELNFTYENYARMFTKPVRDIEQFREMWLQTLQSRAAEGISLQPDWPCWNSHIRLIVGEELYRIVYDHLTFNLNALKMKDSQAIVSRQESPVLYEVTSDTPGETRCLIKIHPNLLKWYRLLGHPPLKFDVTELPMLCPPIPWIDVKNAGYLLASSDTTRLIRRSSYYPGADAAANDDLDFDSSTIPMVFDSLNFLASCPWKVNSKILDAAIFVARSGGEKGLSIPETKTLQPIPSQKFDSSQSREERIKAFKEVCNARNMYNETRSLWATEMYRLSIANQYRDKVFWFPHSMDFRGRVYPCPPHFHHMGSDVARGLIVFAKGIPLGETGLRWLKIHLANLTGMVKRSALSEREEFTEKIIDDVFDSADKPFNGRGWWRAQEEPWQTLACCCELTAALRYRDSSTGKENPAAFVNHFPVHQDGSCNGLQHYAAIGRDERGAMSVSLKDCERPRDVYTDVTEVVEAQRAVDAAAGMPVAQALEGFVHRKVIKQSVMTTVYGVTLYGAMAQIRRQLHDIPEFASSKWLGPAAAYLARLTLASISAIFTSSSETQAWFGQLSRHITKERCCRISWITPLGLPVIQPYVKSINHDVDSYFWSGSQQRSILDISTLSKAAALAEKHRTWKGAKDSLIGLPLPNPIKQKNAFPPNFIHSLDSCHMMLTALHCLREGVVFASVHDCFWTHAASVDKMNRICRKEFTALHSEPILENLSDYLRSKFAYSKSELASLSTEKRVKAEGFNKLLTQFPKRGNFNLAEVLKSTYFFS